ncbi:MULTISPECIES: tRNA pseudouridine(13) synthase TruD [Halolamina]|uniref:Probable tRNA pseudouridine synthase D n=1 Tax=Halolamina pelagica TaxID=699431 RepID=A0A1I5RQW7_9EURY|nr:MULTISPECIES: tRNA pseudouridine(13) synthase TruD [Halolamina]NHX35301.1 tRNA pseudouridine(13) synthase TruD [Halolamina sp. R1-12]SFP60949.1 tRNA pseudouridine13 synthase [Halolamina pelagica]
MREAHPRERTIGVEWYVSDADGVGGRLRDRPDDFRVRELENFDTNPVDAGAGDYPYLVLRATLTGWDTNDFAGRLSDAMEISRERVDWAGTKDKYAVTTQLFSVYDADPEDLPEIRDAEIEVVGRAGRHLSYGDLAGNAFEITVRDPETPANADEITDQLRAFAGDGEGDRIGVPNVFGHQRFGSRRPVTHEVGLAIVRREWREAVLAYVGNPYETEPDDTREARAVVDEQAASDDPDWGACLDVMPRKLGYERSMLHRLQERGAGGADGGEVDAGEDEAADPWRHALEAVPSNLQRLFVNAAQSYAFNRILSERLDRGLPFHEPVAGDVCCFADTGIDAVRKPDPDRIQRATESRVDVLARHCQRGRAFVTAPLIGTGTEFADGEPGEIEREVFDELGLEPALFDLPGNFESTGTRRAILVDTEMGVERDPLTFEFALPSGSYATTVLREYLKTDPTDL